MTPPPQQDPLLRCQDVVFLEPRFGDEPLFSATVSSTHARSRTGDTPRVPVLPFNSSGMGYR